MEEGDPTGQTRTGRGVEQGHLSRREVAEGGRNVGDIEADVMEPLAASGQEAAHPVVEVDGLEQLDLALAGGEQRRPDALVGELGLLDHGQPERVAIERVGIGQPFHHDPDMMNASYHGESPPRQMSAAGRRATASPQMGVMSGPGRGRQVRWPATDPATSTASATS